MREELSRTKVVVQFTKNTRNRIECPTRKYKYSATIPLGGTLVTRGEPDHPREGGGWRKREEGERKMHRSNVFSFKSISADCIRANVVNIITFASRLLETMRISIVQLRRVGIITRRPRGVI